MSAQPMQKDLLRVFIAKDIARTAAIAAGTSAVTPGNLANGEVVITDLGLNVLNTTTVLDQDEIMIVQGRGATKPLIMVKLNVNDIKSYKGKAFSDKVEQVTYVGYDAVNNTGAFDVINDNFYRLQIYMNEQVPSSMHGLYLPIIAEYTSDSTATQVEVVTGVYKSLVTQLAFWKQKQVLAEMVCSDAGTAEGDTATVANGSTIVTMTGTTPLVAGDFIRIGGGADTDAVYQIASQTGTGTNLVLTVPFQGTDGTGITVETITAATAATSDFGIRLTGVERTNFVLDARPFSQATFQVSLIDCGDTAQNTTTDPFMGHGTYEQIATMEHASWGAIGQIHNYKEMIPYTRESDAVSSQDYSTLTITWSKLVGQTTNTKFSGTIMLACSLDGNVASTFDTNIDGGVTSCAEVLDEWIFNKLGLAYQIPNL